MIRDYGLVTPSLEGVLSHDSVVYEGLRRPLEALRVFDGPAKDPENDPDGDKTSKVIEQYFHDLYGIFMKKLSHFIVASEPSPQDSLTLQAMFQELLKVKGILKNIPEKFKN